MVSIAWLLQREIALLAKSPERSKSDLGVVVVFDKQEEIMRTKLRPVVSIGRIPSNTITLDNNYTSAQHALITLRDNQWWLEDLKSRNGTLLNDYPVSTPTVISEGDVVQIGEVSLTMDLT